MNENKNYHSQDFAKKVEDLKYVYENEKKQYENYFNKEKEVLEKTINNLQDKFKLRSF